jgi:cell wall-associated NlpC family hydrolase
MQHNILYLMAFSLVLSGCSGLGIRSVEVPREEPAATPAPAMGKASRTEALLQALLTLDVDYRYGGSSPEQGFDCSGLVAHVFLEAYGIRLPRTVQSQSELGMPVSLTELQPGDLVFYNTLGRPFSHVGIYLGDNRFVHAPKAGARVRVESLRTGFWASRFNGARRIDTST